ncbi:MAG: hypothetical protein LHV68_00260 [Elusimicrobia bacterium]|nr:hypothetical protein [Candidatus Liberimonas magnetica]
MNDHKEVQFAQLLDMNSTTAVFEEVKYNFIHYYPIREFLEVRAAFKCFNDLYDGNYPGYGKCKTKYHDKIHTTDALLSISRLIDGYNLENRTKLQLSRVKTALIASIFHDTGYIQKISDKTGTGAKYTLSHVERSIEFLGKYYKIVKFSRQDYLSAKNMISCTGLMTNLATILFKDKSERLLGYMLGTSDLLGQMASRTYLERLTHLYKEFKEGHVKGYSSEFDLLKKTLKFYDTIKIRLEKDFENVDRYAQTHFKYRYGIDKNLYHIAILRQLHHLKNIIKSGEGSYRAFLKRQSGIS